MESRELERSITGHKPRLVLGLQSLSRFYTEAIPLSIEQTLIVSYCRLYINVYSTCALLGALRSIHAKKKHGAKSIALQWRSDLPARSTVALHSHIHIYSPLSLEISGFLTLFSGYDNKKIYVNTVISQRKSPTEPDCISFLSGKLLRLQYAFVQTFIAF